jgi:hypothetical protein
MLINVSPRCTDKSWFSFGIIFCFSVIAFISQHHSIKQSLTLAN